MNKLLKNWANISVYLGALAALIAVLGNWGLREKTILLSLTFIMLHFYEEFVFPGGFAWCGLKVEMGITDTDATKWPLNRPTCLFGNWWCAVLVYILPLFLPHVKFLTLAVVLFAFIEVIMHGIGFNIGLRTLYNPGLLTALFGLLPVSLNYLILTWDLHLYSLGQLALALVWIVFNYWIAFRSPIYKKLGSLGDEYAFSQDEVWRAKKYIDRFNGN